jgi:Flp pilus assembly protein TadG
VLVLVALAMPLVLALLALVVDGSNLMVHRRAIQNAADAAVLAAAQDLNKADCDATCVGQNAGHYSEVNGGPSTVHHCSGATDTNCYAWPYKGDAHLIEVRLKEAVSTVITSAVGLGSVFNVSARAVSRATPLTAVTPPTTHTTTTPGVTIPESTSTSTTYTPGGVLAVAFAKSTDCAGDSTSAPAGAAIQWTGAPSTLNGLISNGGISISGNVGKTSDHMSLGRYGESKCRDFYGSSTPDPTAFPDVRLLQNAPVPWPVTPPTPAPPAGCSSTTGNTTGTNIISNAIWKLTHPPGVYCWTTGSLSIGANGVSFIGYTFYAPSITISSNGMTFRNASGLNPPTVFYAYGADKSDCSGTKLTSCAFSINGQNNVITGNIFAPSGTIVLAGGGAGTPNGGSGFLESIKLLVSGNYANFNGTGPDIGGTTNTTTTTMPGVTTPDSTSTTTTPGTTSTVGTAIGLNE